MNEQKTIPVRIGEVSLYSQGLVLIKLIDDHEITLKDVKEHVEAARTLTNDADFVILLDGGFTLDVTDEAMTYAAKHENEKWLALAIIVRSISERFLANYYIKFKRPIRSTKAFSGAEDAEKWLKQFIKIEGPVKYDL